MCMYRRLPMKSKRFISLSILTIFSCGLLAAGISLKNNKVVPVDAYYTPDTHYAVSDTMPELLSYYSTVDETKTGNDLLANLRSLNGTKRKRTVGYSTMGTSASSSAYIYTDYVLNSSNVDSNGQRYGTQIASFYTKTTTTGFNKEHMWPKSHGGNLIEADILHTRPTISSENSDRGNSFYVEGMNSQSGGWDPKTAGYDEWCRGECARTILYGCVASSSLSLCDLNSHATSNNNRDNLMGNINTLIKWHFEYTPNEYEINRNNGAEYLQGNRNPFVDHPEYVAKIWGDFNSTVTALCSSYSSVYSHWTVGSYSTYGTNDAAHGTSSNWVSINKASATIAVEESTVLSATSSDGGAISWSSSNTDVATVGTATSASGTEITVTGVSAGTAVITASRFIEGNTYSKACTITVTSSGGGGGDIPVPTGSYEIVPVDLDSSYPSSAKSYTAASGIKFTAQNCANYGEKVQFKKNGGYLCNNDSLNLASLTFTALGGSGSISVYVGASANTQGNLVTPSDGVYNLYGYHYFKIINSSDNVVTCSTITINISDATPAALSYISVANEPNETEYIEGEYFDPTGLVINRYYSDESHNTYTYEGHEAEFSFVPSTGTALTTSDTSVTITYGGLSCTQEIEVNPPYVPVTLVSISLSGQTTEFNVGDEFSFGGVVTALFSDGEEIDVTSETTFTGYDMAVAGAYTITASYTYEGVTKTATYIVTVNEEIVPPAPVPIKKGCGGSVVATSVILSILSLTGVALLTIKKHKEK